MLDPRSRLLGRITAGSLSDGIEARLRPNVSVEDMAVGRYVVIEGRDSRFFGMITDVRLDTANPDALGVSDEIDDPLLAEVLAGSSAFGTLEIRPMLTIPREGTPNSGGGPQPVRTVPAHFAPVAEAIDSDIDTVFGAEDATHFWIGTPIDMNAPVCLDLKRFVARSSGVFGKSGTGKTFLTRLLLAGIVQKDIAVNLVFDMHSEYGWRGTSEGAGGQVKGLKQLFDARVSVFTLDEKSSRDRGVSADHVVEIGLDQISPEDFELMAEALDMTQAQCESVHRLSNRLGHDWLSRFSDSEANERESLAAEFGLNPSTLNVLHRKIERLLRLPFLKRRTDTNSVQRLLDTLRRGRHVVLEFGGHGSLDSYILVANILTRRIHESYVVEKDQALAGKGSEPPPLVITIEEAHKFLGPQMAGKTIFGTIARELRKYNVTLLIVDQRPSQIDAEVLSQIGTRVTCLLDDESDVGAVLGGISGASALRSVLARLDSRQQAIVLGHAVPMPVVIRTRDYGPDFYAAMARGRVSLPTIVSDAAAIEDGATSAQRADRIRALFDS
ncbi:MAG: ATP-binding protein [Chloroflexota bacterium]|nr:MAG: ATP-binding protein [Chloroflexota bacterium]